MTNPLIFREYDIRGVADRDLTSDCILLIGKAFGTYLIRNHKKTISIGRDVRKSSPRIHKSLVEGLLSTGLHIVDVGEVTTPCLYYSIHELKLDGGVMITGSHNPADQNGLKMCIGTASLFGSQIQELKGLIEKNDFLNGKGSIEQKIILPQYEECIFKQFQFKKRLKIVVDCGNGMTGILAPRLFQRLGHEVIGLYTNPDGSFPNHPADPSEPENMQDLVRAVQKHSADLGIAFDGDGDRVGVIDDKGNYIFSDQLLAVLAKAVIEANPGATVIADVKCSTFLFDEIKKAGGKPIMWKTGHSLIKAKMKEEHAALAGEASGHIFFSHRWFGFDSGIYSACRLLEILDTSGKSLSQLLAQLPKSFTTPEIRVPCADEKKFDVVREAVESFKQKYRVVDIDGARVEFDDGWGLVRASNTQPVLVMRFEAQSEKRLKAIRGIIESKVQELMA